ncbi:MAG TPA: SDR family NAD(P)-dependent oxidoreductase [Sporichthyaceae bacterium]|jgi:NAD(P)-dependent dehydrogenase (short-subunit alcohol dehydrogenase family)|nr:SDR family NAD(P)-dependent oxidoreductase [Sporichthyaceae bacterium]
MSERSFGFGFETTTDEVIAGIDLTGRRAVVTGGASGIGLETARVLAGAGAEVTIAVRDLAAGERAADAIAQSTGEKVLLAPLDLADLDSVRAFVADWSGPLHILVDNAGVMACPLTRTPQGWELQFATNHVGHFALTTGLHPALAAAGNARVVVVSSLGHLRSAVDFDDLHFHSRPYEPFAAYGQSKTANILFAVEADRRWASEGIRVNALHPGSIRTALQRHVDDSVLDRMRAAMGLGLSELKTVEQGAATQVLLAASPLVEGIGGEYFQDCAIAAAHVPGTHSGVADYARHPAMAGRLWRLSEGLIQF